MNCVLTCNMYNRSLAQIYVCTYQIYQYWFSAAYPTIFSCVAKGILRRGQAVVGFPISQQWYAPLPQLCFCVKGPVPSTIMPTSIPASRLLMANNLVTYSGSPFKPSVRNQFYQDVSPYTSLKCSRASSIYTEPNAFLPFPTRIIFDIL